MPFTWSHHALVRAPPDAVYAWLTDFREDDHARPAFRRGAGMPDDGAPAVRRVTRREGNVVELDDAWGKERFRTTATLVPERREVRIAGGFGYRSVWRAEPAGDGRTRLVVEGEMRGLGGLVARLFAAKMRAQGEADFRGHVADLEAELAGDDG